MTWIFVVYLLSLVVNDSCSASLLCNLGLGVLSSFSPLGDLLGAVNHSPLLKMVILLV